MYRALTFLLVSWLPLACFGLGGDFRLTDHNGEPYSLADDRGKVVVMAFGYTHCPDVCPVMLATITAALHKLGPRSEGVQPLFVTVDPDRDTAKRLKEYVTWFHPRMIGLTGSTGAIEQVAKQYRVRYRFEGKDGGATDYTVDHTSSIYVIGADGLLLQIVPHGAPLKVLVNAIDRALSRTL